MLELLASDFRPVLQDVLFLTLLTATLIWGAGPERAISVTWLLFFELIPGFYSGFLQVGQQMEHVDLFYASMDGLAGIAWISIALNANRNYPLFIAAMQVLAIAAHLARGLIETISPIAYATMVAAPGWIQLFILMIGLIRHARRQRRYGAYREWRIPLHLPRLPVLGSREG